ncbi:MAG TPA: wax ester/triacylglycerol synthase family O-acyltransferase [Dehalococcoidia bacterium]|nr:wax ester/triacylglycerol synthase family O-acyltransferase [Dehalococcoidia bacterium]
MTRPDLNRRLSTQDASFLYAEKPNQPMHVGMVAIYAGRLTRQAVLDALRSRLHLLPRYRQRLMFPPFGIAHPTWEDDPAFELERHVEEHTLPAPGNREALSRVAGELYAPLMDRTRPMWQLYLLHGYEDGQTAMLWKIHHCMVDGVSSVELLLVMHDLTAKSVPPEPPAAPWQPQPLPDPLTLFQDAVRDVSTEAAAAWTDRSFETLRPGVAAERARQMNTAYTTSLPFVTRPAPRTPFNGPISGQRHFTWFECAFADVRAIRTALGGTVNDVVLTLVAGALRRYLLAHGYPVEGVELRAMCPVSMRRPEEQGALGNLVSMMIAPLYVGIADPVARLARERQTMEQLKRDGQAAAFYALSDLARNVPVPMQVYSAQSNAPNTLLNTVSTNVPGPQIPLYLNGHELRHYYGVGILSNGIGLFVAITSYNQRLAFGLLADPQLVPDNWFVAECFEQSFDELLGAARAAGAPAENPPAARPRQATAAGQRDG